MTLSGRDDETRRLAEAVASDEVQAVLVTGVAGVGKTSLVARHVADSPHLVLRGQCVPLSQAIAHLPLLGALGSRAPEVRAAVDAALAGLAPHLAESLYGVLPHLASAAANSPGTEDRLFIGVGELLAEMATSVSVTLVIEDAHWGDQATLDLLTYLMLARNDPGVTVVVTYRSDEADPALAAQSWLDRVRMTPSVVEVALAPLDRAAFEDQLAALAPGIESSTADRLFERSEGNPFYTEQLVATLGDGSTGPLPDRVVALLGRRLDRLSPAHRQLMVLLALAATPIGRRPRAPGRHLRGRDRAGGASSGRRQPGHRCGPPGAAPACSGPGGRFGRLSSPARRDARTIGRGARGDRRPRLGS